MELGLNGRTSLVFGAGGGLGSAIARALAAEGAAVALADRDGEAAETAALAIRDAGGTAVAVPWDLADFTAIEANVDGVRQTVGEIDILVNNTAGPPPTPVLGQDRKLWTSSWESMVLSVIAITDAIVPGMCQRGWGRVITSASSGVVAPIANLGISNTVRSSLVGWSKTLSREVAPHGVTANVIVPGRIATPRITFLDARRAERDGRTIDEVAADSFASIPAGRYGEPDEYAAVVAFLASRQASYVTGSVIRVDGGLIPSV